MTFVSIIIINYNNSGYLRRSLAAAKAAQPYEIIVVDDASTDDSCEFLNRCAGITVIRNPQNQGPVRSRNIGATKARGRYLLFVDSDAAIAPDYAQTLADFLESTPKAGVASGKVIETTGDRMWYNFGYDPNRLRDVIGHPLSVLASRVPLGFLKWLSRPFTHNYAPDKVRAVDWVVEMGIMTRRDLFEELGGFDAVSFYMFFEGPDYCRRARAAGYGVHYVPSAVISHLGGHSHPVKRRAIHVSSRKAYFQKWGVIA